MWTMHIYIQEKFDIMLNSCSILSLEKEQCQEQKFLKNELRSGTNQQDKHHISLQVIHVTTLRRSAMATKESTYDGQTEMFLQSRSGD